MGEAKNAQAKNQAVSLASKVFKGFSIDHSGLTIPGMKPPGLRIQRGAEVVLSGSVPNVRYKQEIEDAFQAAEPNTSIRNEITVTPNLSQPEWLKTFRVWWTKLRGLVPNPSLVINENEMQVFGNPDTRQKGMQAETMLVTAIGEDYKLTNKLTLPALRPTHTGAGTKRRSDRGERRGANDGLSESNLESG